jgi:hypothetical protein
MVLAGFVLLAAVSALAADKEDETQASYWMQKKLSYSERILSGLASNDFGEIAKNARSRKALNQMEKWVRGNTAEYRTQLTIFQSANE